MEILLRIFHQMENVVRDRTGDKPDIPRAVTDKPPEKKELRSTDAVALDLHLISAAQRPGERRETAGTDAWFVSEGNGSLPFAPPSEFGTCD